MSTGPRAPAAASRAAVRLPRGAPDPAAVLTKAFLRAGALLGLTQRHLARVVGASEASVSRLTGERRIEPSSKEGELALLFLRVFRSLDTLFGGDTSAARAWLLAENLHVGGKPIELLETAAGLVRVGDYLDAIRGRG